MWSSVTRPVCRIPPLGSRFECKAREPLSSLENRNREQY